MGILIGSLNDTNFQYGRSRINFAEFLSWNIEQKKTASY